MAGRKNEVVRMGGNGRRSLSVQYGDLVYVSGITTVALEADMTGQARDVFAQIDRLLATHGTDKTRVLSANIYLRSMAEYGDFNAVWDEWVLDGFEPARSVVEAGLALPEYRLKVSVVAAAG